MTETKKENCTGKKKIRISTNLPVSVFRTTTHDEDTLYFKVFKKIQATYIGFATPARSLNNNQTTNFRVADGTINWCMTLAFRMEMFLTVSRDLCFETRCQV